MRITDYLRPANIYLDVPLSDKTGVLRYVAEVCVKNGIVDHFDQLYKGLLEREETMSTGVGGGIGFPHTTSPEAENAAVLLIRLKTPVPFEALDHRPVDVILSLIIPEADPAIHVRLLARVSRLCRNPDFLKAVKQENDPRRLWDEIDRLEQSTAPVRPGIT